MTTEARAMSGRDWTSSRVRLNKTNNRFGIPSPEVLAATIVCAAVVFNLGLAFLNAHLLGVTRGHVILVEIFIVGAALTICMMSANQLMLPWATVFWLLATILLVSALVRQSFEPKHFRDILLIPIFIALGTSFAKGNIIRLFCFLQAVILAVAIFEALAPNAFGGIFNPASYYVRTRGLNEETFWNSESQLYLSAFRPTGRIFLEWLGIHRLSSVFLEPVSLGNWCIIVTIFITAFWRFMSRKALVFLGLSNIVLLVGSDGRLAMVSSILILVLSIFAFRLPRYIYFFYLPAAIVVAVIATVTFALDPIGDDFPSRIAGSMATLASFDLPAILGIDHTLINRSFDSGIGYLVLSQSIFGISVLWIAICFLQPPTSYRAVVLMQGICVYVALVLLVSYSLFSIKTAAPMWFLYGFVRARSFFEGNMVDREKSIAG